MPGHADATRQITGRFRGRMLPLAAIVGVFVAVIPPAFYAFNAKARLDADATRTAEAIALEVGRVAERQPDLWPYNLPKVVRALAPLRGASGIAQVTVRACDGSIRFPSERLGFGPPDPTDIVVRRPVRGAAGVVAWVDVGVPSRTERATLRLWTVASGVLGFALALLLFFFPTRVVGRAARRVEEANRDLARAHAKLRTTNRELEDRVAAGGERLRALARDAVDVQERERARIARDLHDSLGQHLAAQRFALDRLGEVVAHDEIARLRDINAALFDDLRRTIHDLGPAELDRGTLAEAVRARCEAFELRSGLPVSARVDAPFHVDPRVARTLVRVLEEALTNILRHADATEVGVACTVESGMAIVRVWDDGRGWPDDGPPIGVGTGLIGMQTRLELVGGALELGSSDSGGTLLTARAPTALPDGEG